jgi:plastocyanin
MKLYSKALIVLIALVVTLIVSLVLTFAYFTKDTVMQKDPRHYVIEVGDFFFDPPGLLVQSGDTIEWVFREITVDGHTVTAYHPANFRHELRIPEGASPFDSGIRDRVGDTFALTFDAVGVYDYFCLPHEFFGMVGRLIVEEPVGPGTQPITVGLPEAAQKAMPSIEEVLGPVGLLFRLSAEVNTVVLEYERSRREQALKLFDELLKSFKAGEGQEGSLFEVLKRVQLVAEVQQKLEELRALIAKSAVLQDVQDRARELKTLLAEARKRL